MAEPAPEFELTIKIHKFTPETAAFIERDMRKFFVSAARATAIKECIKTLEALLKTEPSNG